MENLSDKEIKLLDLCNFYLGFKIPEEELAKKSNVKKIASAALMKFNPEFFHYHGCSMLSIRILLSKSLGFRHYVLSGTYVPNFLLSVSES